MFDGKRCRKSLGLEKLAVGRYDLLPLRGTANSPPTFMVYWPRAPMPDGKRCKMSLGLEPSLRAGSLYAYGIMTVGRNAVTSLENAADKRRMRIAFGSVHGIMNYISKAFLLRRASPYVGSARSVDEDEAGALFLGVSVQRSLFPSHPSHHALARRTRRLTYEERPL